MVQLFVSLLAVLPGIVLLENKQLRLIDQVRLQVGFRVIPGVVKLVSRLHSSPGISTEPTDLYALVFSVLPNVLPFNCPIHLIAQFMVILDLTELFSEV